MTTQTAIAKYIRATAAITNIVGDRVYPVRQGTLTGFTPGITYERENFDGDVTNDGASGFTTINLKLTVGSYSYDQMVTIRELLKDLLSGYRGTLNTVKIHGIHWDDDSEIDSPDTDEGRPTFQCEIHLKVQSAEAVPSNTRVDLTTITSVVLQDASTVIVTFSRGLTDDEAAGILEEISEFTCPDIEGVADLFLETGDPEDKVWSIHLLGNQALGASMSWELGADGNWPNVLQPQSGSITE